MARKALKNSCNARQTDRENALRSGKKPEFPTRAYNRCGKCGKVRGYMRRFGLCRICFRELAREGLVMGVKKSSW